MTQLNLKFVSGTETYLFLSASSLLPQSSLSPMILTIHRNSSSMILYKFRKFELIFYAINFRKFFNLNFLNFKILSDALLVIIQRAHTGFSANI